jgi:hypothetical protein
MSGRKLPLLDVITKSLKYIKDEAIREVNSSQMVPVKLEDIQWLVTVPAIWSDVAKVRSTVEAAMRSNDTIHIQLPCD